MPFVKPGTEFPERTYLPEPPDADVPWSDIFAASIRQESPTAGIVSALVDEHNRPEAVVDYEAWDDMQGYEEWAWDLADATSPDDMRGMKSRIDQELNDRRILDMSGGAGIATSMAAGILDPLAVAFMAVPLVGPAARLAGAARTGLRGAAVVGAEETLSEAVLRKQQTQRTPLESVFNITAGTMMGGVLGAAAGAMVKSQFKAAARHTADTFNDTKQMGDLPDVDPVTNRSLSADVAEDLTPEELDLYPASKLVKFARLNALGQLATSRSAKVAQLGLRLAENAFRYTPLVKNLKAVPQAVESVIKSWTEGAYGISVKHTRYQYKAYRKRMKGSPDPKMSEGEFRIAVGRAVASRESDVPEVGNAAAYWNKRVYDPILKRSMEVNLFGKDFDPGEQSRYVNRVYDRGRLQDKRPEFADILYKWIRADAKAGSRAADLPEQELYGEINDIIDTLLGWHHGQMDFFDPKGLGKAGSMHARVLRIPDEMIEDFLVRDINHLGRVYTRSVAPRMELAHMSPDNDWEIKGMIDEAMEDLEAQLRRVRETPEDVVRRTTEEIESRTADIDRLGEALETEQARLKRLRKPERIAEQEAKIARMEEALPEERAAHREAITALEAERAAPRAVDQKAIKRLVKEQKFQRKNMLALRDRLVGTYDMPRDPTSFISRIPYFLKTINYLTMMGGMAVSSIPDLARPIFQFGLTRSYGKLVTDMGAVTRNWKAGLDELQKAGSALDYVMASRAKAIADLDEVQPYTRGVRGAEWMTNQLSKWSGMSAWNTTLKGFTGLIGQDRMLRTAVEWAGGGGSKADIEDLLRLGIDESMAKRIANQALNKEDSLWLANTDAWTDEAAVRAFRAGLVKIADTVIITPGVGDMHRFIRGDTVKLFTQFKSFMMATVNRMLIPMAQGMGRADFDPRVYEGLVMSMALGAATYFIKMKLAGREDEIPWDNEGQLIAEAIDRSGMAGPIAELFNLASKVSRGQVGMGMLTGDENRVMSRYGASNSLISLVGGPVTSLATDATRALGAALNPGDVTRADARAIQRLIPYRNLAGINALFSDKEIVDALAGALGAKDVK